MANVKIPQVYACSSLMTSGASADSNANMVQIWLPTMKDRRLSMGEVGMLATESDLPLPLRRLQASVYEKLRGLLTKNFRSGVWGRNSKTGGEHFYEDILISEGGMGAYAGGELSSRRSSGMASLPII